MKKHENSFFLRKSVAAFVAFCFLLTGTFSDLCAAIAKKPVTVSSLIENHIQFPFTKAKIGESKFFNDGDLVINIQDLHCNPSAQYNIAKIIDFFTERYEIEDIYIEGGIGKIDLGWINNVNEERREDLLKTLIDSGQMTGAEYFALRKNKNSLKGLEDKELYEKNIERLAEILSKQDDMQLIKDELDAKIEVLKELYLSKESIMMLDFSTKHRSGHISDKVYFGKMRKMLQKNGISSDKIDVFLEISEISSKLSREKTFFEVNTFLSDAKSMFSRNDYISIMQSVKNASDVFELCSFLNSLHSFDVLKYPQIYNTARLSYLMSRNNIISLIETEQNALYELLYLNSSNNSERDILFLLLQSENFKNYISGNITSENLSVFEKNREDFFLILDKYTGLSGKMKENGMNTVLSEYYSANTERDIIFYKMLFGRMPQRDESAVFEFDIQNDSELFFEALKKGKKAKIVITGGFHTKGLSNIFKENKISYLVVTPSVNSISENYENIYNNYILAEAADISADALALRPYAQKLMGINPADYNFTITEDFVCGRILAEFERGLAPIKVARKINKESQELNASFEYISFNGEIAYFKYNYIHDADNSISFGIKYDKDKAKVEIISIEELEKAASNDPGFMIADKTKETVKKRIVEPFFKLIGRGEKSSSIDKYTELISFFAAPLMEAFLIFNPKAFIEAHSGISKSAAKRSILAVYAVSLFIDAVLLFSLPLNTGLIIVAATLLGTIPAHFIVNIFKAVNSKILKFANEKPEKKAMIKKLVRWALYIFVIAAIIIAALSFFFVLDMSPDEKTQWETQEEVIEQNISLVGFSEVDGYKIIVTDDDGAEIDYEIRGVCYSVDQYGLEFYENFEEDILLLKSLNANAIRTYRPLAAYKDNGEMDYEKTLYMLDRFAQEGITVTVGFDSRRDITGGYDAEINKTYMRGFYKTYIEAFADHPAILMWVFGNEYNYHYDDWFGSKEKWLSILDEAATTAKQLSPERIVAVVHGEIPTRQDFEDYAKIQALDLIMLNIYRGPNFGTLFDEWAALTANSNQPIIISEFGRSSVGGKGRDTTLLQAKWAKSMWTDIDARNDSIGAGAFFFSLKDESWKTEHELSGTIGSEAHLGLFTEDGEAKEAAKILSEAWGGTLPVSEVDYESVGTFRPTAEGVLTKYPWYGREWPANEPEKEEWRTNSMQFEDAVAVHPDGIVRITLKLASSSGLQDPKFMVQLLDTHSSNNANIGVYQEIFHFPAGNDYFTVEIPAIEFEKRYVDLSTINRVNILTGKKVFGQSLNGNNTVSAEVLWLEMTVIPEASLKSQNIPQPSGSASIYELLYPTSDSVFTKPILLESLQPAGGAVKEVLTYSAVEKNFSGITPLAIIGSSFIQAFAAGRKLQKRSFISAGKKVVSGKAKILKKEGLNILSFMPVSKNTNIMETGIKITDTAETGKLLVGKELFDVYADFSSEGIIELYYDGILEDAINENDVYLAMASWIKENKNVQNALNINEAFNIDIFDIATPVSLEEISAANEEYKDTVFVYGKKAYKNGFAIVSFGGILELLTIASGMLNTEKRKGKYKKPAVFAITYENAELLQNEEIFKVNADNGIDTFVIRDISNKDAVRTALILSEKYNIRLIYEADAEDVYYTGLGDFNDLDLDGIRINATKYTGSLTGLRDWIEEVAAVLKRVNKNAVVGFIAPGKTQEVFTGDFFKKAGILECVIYTPSQIAANAGNLKGSNLWIIIDNDASKQSEIRDDSRLEKAIEEVSKSDIALLDVNNSILNSIDVKKKNKNAFFSFIKKVSSFRNADRKISSFDKGKDIARALAENLEKISVQGVLDIVNNKSLSGTEKINMTEQLLRDLDLNRKITTDTVLDIDKYYEGILEGLLEANADKYFEAEFIFKERRDKDYALKYIIEAQKLINSADTNIDVLMKQIQEEDINTDNIPVELLDFILDIQHIDTVDGVAVIREAMGYLSEFSDKVKGNNDAEKLIAVNMLRFIDMISDRKIALSKEASSIMNIRGIRQILTSA